MLAAFNAPRSVYQELMGAGGLSSIGEPAVRRAVADFNSTLDWSRNQNEYLRSDVGWQDPVSLSDERISLRYDNHGGDPDVATFDRQALCADHAFRNKMVASVRNHMVTELSRGHNGRRDPDVRPVGPKPRLHLRSIGRRRTHRGRR
jgi:hypothetical protein